MKLHLTIAATGFAIALMAFATPGFAAQNTQGSANCQETQSCASSGGQMAGTRQQQMRRQMGGDQNGSGLRQKMRQGSSPDQAAYNGAGANNGEGSMTVRKRRHGGAGAQIGQYSGNDQEIQTTRRGGQIGSVNEQEMQMSRRHRGAQMAEGQSWRFSDRHRRHHHDARFRFYFGGFWYDQPYWTERAYFVQDRVGCGEGASIVDSRGFNRVRIVECRGQTFTYLGRRHGVTFQVLLDSFSGRIVGARPV